MTDRTKALSERHDAAREMQGLHESPAPRAMRVTRYENCIVIYLVDLHHSVEHLGPAR